MENARLQPAAVKETHRHSQIQSIRVIKTKSDASFRFECRITRVLSENVQISMHFVYKISEKKKFDQCFSETDLFEATRHFCSRFLFL